mmetsp:Transcript_34721/g.98384  ORF Transcript_34721/g.98384 Transcript_34721/m.98384 type:complete len:140 (+) Transcript_34721:407-826(+)
MTQNHIHIGMNQMTDQTVIGRSVDPSIPVVNNHSCKYFSSSSSRVKETYFLCTGEYLPAFATCEVLPAGLPFLEGCGTRATEGCSFEVLSSALLPTDASGLAPLQRAMPEDIMAPEETAEPGNNEREVSPRGRSLEFVS